MENKLLVRLYDVGFGDSIYVRIPDGEEAFHMLIDCGTSGGAAILKDVVDNVRSMLPVNPDGKRRLDLLVVTHPHADHIKGFNPEWFEDFRIGRIWMSAFMNPAHPQARKAMAFQDQADAEATALLNRSGLKLAAGVQALLRRNVRNNTALEALRHDLPQASGIDADYPLYLTRDTAERLSAEERTRHAFAFEHQTSCFRGFQEQETCLRTLAPEWNIDGYYLGRGALDGHSFSDTSLLAAEGYATGSEAEAPNGDDAEASGSSRIPRPKNISERDFRQLRGRLLYSAVAFTEKDDRIKNNVSIVLLLEWRGRRLLFAGDAEWRGAGVVEERSNDSWDVMLHDPEVRQHLLQPLDLLKVAHHGSHNGTPFGEKDGEEVLKKITAPDRTQIVVSTEAGVHGEERPVPYPPLLEELGRLAANKRKYPNSPEAELRNVFQPQRTDLEATVTGETVRFIDVMLEPADC